MNSKLRSILHLARPYLIIAILPILSVILLSFFIVNKSAEEKTSAWQESVKTAVDRVNRKIDTVEDLAHLVVQSDTVSEYILDQISGKRSDLQSSSRVRDLLSGVAKNDSLIEVFFHDELSGSIIASTTVINDPEIFFRYQYIYDDCTPQEAAERIDSNEIRRGFTKTRHVTSNGYSADVIEYNVFVPRVKGTANPALLVVSINTKNLFSDLYDIMSPGSAFYVADDNGVIYSSSEEILNYPELPVSDTLQPVDAVENDVRGMARLCNLDRWRIGCYIPTGELRESVGTTALRFLPVVLLVLLCLVLCVYYTHKNRRQIISILKAFKSGQPEAQEEQIDYVDYKMIQSYADNAAKNSYLYREKIREMEKSQKNRTLRHLLKGTYTTEEDRCRAMELLGDIKDAERYVVLCIQFEEPAGIPDEEEVGIRELVFELLETEIGAEMDIVDMLSSELVCILYTDEDYSHVVNEIISQLNVQIKYEYNAELRIGAGQPTDSFEDISSSYKQALEIIRYSENTGKSVYFYSEADFSEETVFYPEQTDDKISNYIIAGYTDEACAMIEEIYNKNFVENTRILSLKEINILRYRITNAVVSVAKKQGIKLSDEDSKFINEKDNKVFFDLLKDTVKVMTDNIKEKKSSVQNLLAVKVNDYIAEHYADTGLNIKQIAWHFHFHENYISNLYRKEYNINLSSAIEKLRIEKACSLLETTDIRVGEVAEAVGYSLDSSFRRAFKKITGVSPAEYRSLHERNS
ncbi:MAG: helix-turn-helix domain-containing protein [Lachnospiraceae bacterium]|nr:helix-turn-helix domain-containing protein [Lachnospiraceae bacterium]